MNVDRAIHLTLSRVEGRMDTGTFTDRYQLSKALEKLFSYDEYKQALGAALTSAKLDSEALNGGPDPMESDNEHSR